MGRRNARFPEDAAPDAAPDDEMQQLRPRLPLLETSFTKELQDDNILFVLPVFTKT